MKKLALFFLSFSLTGCGSVISKRTPCPKSAILAEFSKTIELKTAPPVRTEIDSLLSTCIAEGQYTLMDFRLRFTSFRPRSAFLPRVTLKPSYFVAVVDEAGNILSRTDHDLIVVFEEKQMTKVSFEQLQERIPMGKAATVYVGFNIDQPQFEFLSKERERKVSGPYDTNNEKNSAPLTKSF